MNSMVSQVKSELTKFGRVARFGTLSSLLSVLSGCGGTTTRSEGSLSLGQNGYVFDGYVDGARVFRDANKNGIFDPNEYFSITDSNGFFGNLGGFGDFTVDSNNKQAVDVQTGLPFRFTMEAPEGYSVINPVTTVVSALVRNGMDTNEAEVAVKKAFGLEAQLNLKTFDPYVAIQDPSAASYKILSVQLANIFTLADDSPNVNSIETYLATINNFAELVELKNGANAQINLSDKNDLLSIMPATALSTINSLAAANSSQNYKDILDGQLELLSSNSGGTITKDTDQDYYLISVYFPEAIDPGSNYIIKLIAQNSGIEIQSSELVSFGEKVGLFRFSSTDISKLGFSDIQIEVTEASSNQTFVDGVFSISTSTQSADETVLSSGTVVDGLISNARVFRDTNDNNQYDLGEPVAYTNEQGKFSGLAGNPSLPIKVDDNDETALDVGDGTGNSAATAFTGMLTAPSGSTIISPITTVIHEVMKEQSVTVEEANLRVAKLLSLDTLQVDGKTVDLTTYDLKLDGTETASNQIYTKTAFLGNAILGTAKAGGGSSSDMASAALQVAKKIANEAASANPSAISFAEADLENFLVKVTGLSASDPVVSATTNSYVGGATKTPTQIAAATRAVFDVFADGFLTSSEAADDITLTIGETYNSSNPSVPVIKNGNAAIKIETPNGGVYVDTFNINNSTYGYVDITKEDLSGSINSGNLDILVKEVGSGVEVKTVQQFDALPSSSVIYESNSLYFYKGIFPEVVIDTAKIILNPVNGEVRLGSESSGFSINGTISIDVGAAGLPSNLSLEDLLKNDPLNGDNTLRDVVIDIKNNSGDVVYSLKASLTGTATLSDPGNLGENTKIEYDWEANTSDFTNQKFAGVAFADLLKGSYDGSYSVIASFTDALGSSNLDNDERIVSNDTFSQLVIDASDPSIAGASVNSNEVNIGQNIVYTVTASEPIGRLDAGEMLLTGGPSGNVTVTSDMVAISSSDNKKFTVTYTPTGETVGSGLDLLIDSNAIFDVSGNPNSTVEPIKVSDLTGPTNELTVGFVKFDMVTPTIGQSDIKIIQTIGSDEQEVTKLISPYDSSGTKNKTFALEITASDDLSAARSANVTIASSSGATIFKPLNLVTSGGKITTDLDLATGGFDLEDTFVVTLRDIKDDFGNPISGSITKTFDVDTWAPTPKVMRIVNDQQTYLKGDIISLEVRFNQAIHDYSGSPVIPLSLESGTVYAELDPSSVTGAATVQFKYTIGSSDTSGDGQVTIGSAIINKPETSNAAFYDAASGVNRNEASLDLTLADTQLTTLGGRSIMGGDAGSLLDGFIDGAVVFSDNDGGGLGADDPIAQSDPTGGFVIFGADGPLAMEGGFDISTNKNFNVRYEAPPGAAIINPITTLIVHHPSTISEAETIDDYAVSSVYSEMKNPLGVGNDNLLLSYNSYDAIGAAVDAASVEEVEATVAQALAFQKIAASVALIGDFVSSAIHFADTSSSPTSIADTSTNVFKAIAANLNYVVDPFAVGGALGKDVISAYIDNFNSNTVNTDVNTLATNLSTMLSGVSGMSNVVSNWPTDPGNTIYDLLANALVAINNANPLTGHSNVLDAAEDGIDKLTEIVQVQKVVQNNMLRSLEAYFENDEIVTFPLDVSVSQLLGTYEQEPVGTVVPIRYKLALKDGDPYSAFEGNEDGSPSQFSFTITRSGSIKTQSSVQYEISGDVTSDDIDANSLSGEIFFDVNQKIANLTIDLINDDIEENLETLLVEISDPTQTATIEVGRVSVEIKDDDPSTPQLSTSRVEYDLGEGVIDENDVAQPSSIRLDPILLDYFDQNAEFSVTPTISQGSVTVAHVPSDFDEISDYQEYFNFEQSLRNVTYSTDGIASDTTVASVILTVSATEDVTISTEESVDVQTAIGRQSDEQIDFIFNIHRTPTLDVTSVSLPSDAPIAGETVNISGIEVSDLDSETVSVTLTSSIVGEFSTPETTGVSITRDGSGRFVIFGNVDEVQTELDGLNFVAQEAGNVTISVSVDDGDPIHVRNASTGLLEDTPLNASMNVDLASFAVDGAPPEIIQEFIPSIRISAANVNAWSKFSGIKVSDYDTAEGLTLTVTSGNDPESGEQGVFFRLVDNSGGQELITEKDSGFSLIGTADEINAKLEQLEVELFYDLDDLITFSISDGDPTTSNVNYQAIYDPTANAIPLSGGDISLSANDYAIEEDVQQPISITVSGVRLFDTNLSPSQIKFVGFNGGMASIAGQDVILEDGTEIPITKSEEGDFTFGFKPSANFFGTAELEYVVIDPEDPAITSSPSKLYIPVASVNDLPTINLSSQTVTYVEGSAPIDLFENSSVLDIDSNEVSEIRISGLNSATDNIIAPVLYGFSAQEESDGVVIINGQSNLTLSQASEYLASIQYFSTSENLLDVFGNDQLLNLSLEVVDSEGAKSSSARKSIRLENVNDAHEVSWNNPEANASSDKLVSQILENDGEKFIFTDEFISISDHEEDNISNISVEISRGYEVQFDSLKVSSETLNTYANEATFDFNPSNGLLSISASQTEGFSINTAKDILSGVSFENKSENPDENFNKALKVTLTDVHGAISATDDNIFTIKPINDAPKVFTVVGATQKTTGEGEAFVISGQPTKVMPSVLISDVDNQKYSEATLTVNSLNIAKGELTLSPSGLLIKKANGLEFYKPIEGQQSYYSIKKPILGEDLVTVTGYADISKNVLVNILREVSFSYVGELENDEQQSVTLVVFDAEGLSSASYVSTIDVLTAPSVQVLADRQGVDDEFALLDAETNPISVPEGFHSGDLTFKHVLKFNPSFSASELFIDLETSNIRTETGRFSYDYEKNTIDLSRAGHIDLTEISLADGESLTTNILGQAPDTELASELGISVVYSDLILGSKYDDAIDGRGGFDVIKAGAGNDIVTYRVQAADAGSKYDGGTGNDTLALSADFSGSAVNLQTLEDSGSVIGFENIDATAVTSSVVLDGNTAANTLKGGSGDDTIYLGPGGDTAIGGSGSDIFVIDISTTETSGSKVLDLTRFDKIQIIDSTPGSLKPTLNPEIWSVDTDKVSATAGDGKLDAWINKNDIGNYQINIEVDDITGGTKTIDIGTRLYGTPQKWLSTDVDGYSVIQPVLNAETEIDNFGILSNSSQAVPLVSAGTKTVNAKDFYSNDVARTVTSFDMNLTAEQTLSVIDADTDDTLTLELYFKETSADFSKLNLSDINYDLPLVGILPETRTEDKITIKGTQTAINEVLASVSISVDEALTGALVISVTDGYAEAPQVLKEIFFKSPNTPFSDFKFSKVVGSDEDLKVGDFYHLSPANVSIDIFDQDSIDREGGISAQIEVLDGSIYEFVNGEYVSLGSRINIETDTDAAANENWLSEMFSIISSLAITKDVVGKTSVLFELRDSSGSVEVKNFDVDFAPKAPGQPELYIYSEKQTDTNQTINKSAFEGAKIRVSTKDIGAKIGDKIEFYTDPSSLSGTLGTPAFTYTLGASSLDASKVQPFVEIDLDNIFEGSLEDGVYSVLPALKVSGYDAEVAPGSVTVTLDATAPATPIISKINNEAKGDLPFFLTKNGDVEIELSSSSTDVANYVVGRIIDGNVKDWYDVNGLLEADVKDAKQELITAFELVLNEETGLYEVQEELEPGLYAVFATDAVGNISEFIPPKLQGNIENQLSYFAIDNLDINISDISITAQVENETAKKSLGGGSYEYTINKKLSEHFPVSFGSNDKLEDDVTKLTLKVWYGEATTGAEDISVDFTRSFSDDVWMSGSSVITSGLMYQGEVLPTNQTGTTIFGKYYTLSENQYGTHSAGNYIIKASENGFVGYNVTGVGTFEDQHIVSTTEISFTTPEGFDLQSLTEAGEVKDLVSGYYYTLSENQFGVHEAGNYVIVRGSSGTYSGHLLSEGYLPAETSVALSKLNDEIFTGIGSDGSIFRINLDGAPTTANKISIEFEFEDLAGNKISLKSWESEPKQEFKLDFSADDDPALKLVSNLELNNGISVEELSAISEFAISGKDDDLAKLTTIFLTEEQIRSHLKPVNVEEIESEPAGAISFFGSDTDQSGETNAVFAAGGIHYYLDVDNDFKMSLTDVYGTSVSGIDLNDLAWVGTSKNSLGQVVAEYAKVDDYDDYEEESIYSLTQSEHGVSKDGFYVVRGTLEAGNVRAFEITGDGTAQSPYARSVSADVGFEESDVTISEIDVSKLSAEAFTYSDVKKYQSTFVFNNFDDTAMSGGLLSFSQSFNPLTPAADADLYAVHRIVDTAGNISYSWGFDGSNTLRIDVTDPLKPNLKIDRAEIKSEKPYLDHWDVLNSDGAKDGIKFTLEKFDQTDEISNVFVNDNYEAIYDQITGTYFVGIEALKDSGELETDPNIISYDITETSGNVANYNHEFFYDEDQVPDQFVSLVGTITSETEIIFEVYLSDQALSYRSDNSFLGTSLDLKFSLPVELDVNKLEVEATSEFSTALSGSNPGVLDISDNGSVRWSTFVNELEFTSLEDPILTFKYDNSESDVALDAEVLSFNFSNEPLVNNFIIINDKVIDYDSDINGLLYEVDLSELLSPIDVL